MADTDKRIADAQKKIEEANQKVVDARGGNVVSHISAFGTPSTYEDPQSDNGKAIAQLDDESRTQDLDKYEDEKESAVKAQEAAADEAVAVAEASAAQAEVEASIDPAESEKASADIQAANEERANNVRTAITEANKQ